MTEIEILEAGDVCIAVEIGAGVPSILHWGARTSVSLLADHVQVPGAIDVVRRHPLVPLHGDGFPGRPGLLGHRRGGRHWAPRFTHVDHTCIETSSTSRLETRSRDDVAELDLICRIELDSDGVLVVSTQIDNTGQSSYMLDALTVTFPFPAHAGSLGTLHGRWAREFQLETFEWMHGTWTAENRSGRSSHEHPPYLWILESNATESTGDVWGVHVAWSGNHVVAAERLTDGRRYVQAGELFHPGEIAIEPGASFRTPDAIGVFSAHGLTPASWGFHRYARRIAPVRTKPRPVHVNTWEGVYFDHDRQRLEALADAAAEVGVERFVLDDGWFSSRRDDRSGLGDWWVAEDVHPDGLGPLIEHVRSRGMEFGIWFEPEMANLDSDVVRAHPDWVLGSRGYEPILGRNQVVLDITRADVFDHVVEGVDRILRDNAIDYVKWDMNRPLVQGSDEGGKAVGHRHVVMLYRMLDTLRERHPHIEFESCASGGGRIDHEILRRVERVWTSDSNDALERQSIQRGASMVLPLEFLGSHIGPSPSHTTRRRHAMSFRGATALFGHLGVEADITSLDDRERSDLARVIEVYKEFRDLLHSGDVVRLVPNVVSSMSAVFAHGVVSQDRSEAIVCIAQLSSESNAVPDPIRLAHLHPESEYEVRFVPLSGGQMSGDRLGPAVRQPSWLGASLEGRPITVSGRALAVNGLPRPVLWPESAIVVHLRSS